MKNFITIISIFSILFIFACSSSQKTTNNEEAGKEEIYVFDDPVTDVENKEPVVQTEPIEAESDSVNFVRDEPTEVGENVDKNIKQTPSFIVQVGAFTSKDKAETFVNENQKDISYKMAIEYSTKVNLFVVWLPKFTSRDEAEKVRNSLWNKEKFKDAFIVTIE